MLTAEAQEYIDLLLDNPLQVAHWLGFDKLTALHNGWMQSFITGSEDETTQAHRGSYKTTCVSVAIAIVMVLRPNKAVLFMRKTDDDVKEIIEQVRKNLQSETMQHITAKIYGRPVKLLKTNANEISTDLVTRPSGSVQLMGIGIKGSLTGKHFDIIFTDDIVNLKDRVSRAEREFTKQVYMELQNIKNRGGRIVNTGTPWHKEDAFTLMPAAKTYDCYSTGLISREELEEIRQKTAPSLFAANYELKHIASEQALFPTAPRFTKDPAMLHNGFAHIDAAYGGEDACALTLGRRVGDTIYLLGKKRPGHIDNCLAEFMLIKNQYMCGTVLLEDNADKGYLAKEVRKLGEPASGYHEKMNKYIKIATYLRGSWANIVFHEDTDPEYINEILDYTEDAEHDDCPDSAASLVMRKLARARRKYLGEE